MSTKRPNILERHTAVPQLSGYLYQIQRALLRLFDLQEGESLGIEILDDNHIEQNGDMTELDQFKYHSPEQDVILRDSSPELWKTLGIWAAAIMDKSLDLSTVQLLVLITRANLAKDSALEIVANNSYNEVEIADRFLAVPYPKSKDKQLLDSFAAIHALPKDLLYILFKRLRIHARQPSLTETFEHLHARLHCIGFHEVSIDDAVKFFCGWIWEKVLLGLESSKGALISEDSFHKAKCLIRDKFIDDKLYPRYAEMNINDVDFLSQINMKYVKQLEIIGANIEVKRQSIIDYFRAVRERTDWLEKVEILPHQLTSFDQELVDRWKLEFDDIVLYEVPEETTDEYLCLLGLKIFRTIRRIDVPIQPGWIYSYLTRGSFQVLSDELRVGWHPRFQALLSSS